MSTPSVRVKEFLLGWIKSRKEGSHSEIRLGAAILTSDDLQEVLDELEGLRGFKRSVDEALNSGDGSYRP